MSHLARLVATLGRFRSSAIELAGLVLVACGVEQIYPPAAFVLAGAALVFFAQGMERHE
jgi:hypothetical protein